MAITLKLPDNSPENKRRMVAASGGYNVPDITNNDNSHYVKSTTVHMPIAKFSQSAGGGGNVTMTQPEFFSPMHTAQNWQIPARRRELIQWSFIDNKESPCYITKNGEFSLINIKDIVEKYEDLDKLYIQNGKGEKATIDRVAKRYVNKKANKIRILGIAEDLYVTNDHDCMIIKREDVKCSKAEGSKYRTGICNYISDFCKKKKCDDCMNKEYKISKIKARDVKKGDYVLVPFDTTIKKSVIQNEEQARFAGHLASDGYIYTRGKYTSICMNTEEINYVFPCIEKVFNDHSVVATLPKKHKIKKVIGIGTAKRSLFRFSSSLVKGKGAEKKFTEEVTLLKPELQLHVLGAYIQSDGCFNKANKCVEITTYSRHLANQLINMMYRCNILGRVNKQPISGSEKTFFTKNKYRYIVNISSSECYKIKKYVPGKIKKDEKFKIKRHNKRFFWKNYVVAPVSSNESFDYEGFVYDIREPKTFTVTANGISIYQCRHFYLNEPKVAAGVDFYSTFSQSGFKLECKDRKILKYYEKLAEKLELTEKLQSISHDYFLLGDVFPFLEIECPNCKKAAENGKECKHPDGTFKAIKVMNPDYIEVKDSPITTKPEYYLMPDDELKQIVQRREPRKIYDSLPEIVKNLISAGQPIPLSDKSISHLKHNASDYATYGTPMMQRLFVYLAYKTKIMTANWIIAGRLIIPVRIVKVGDEKRPATESDLQDVQSQLAAVANDPNLTLITHHSFELDWVGAEGKIHNITPELELIGKEILDGLMLNQALLNGDATSYSSSQVGVETLIKRLETWRNKLKDWVERRIFLPIAMMQGFIDEEESKKLNSVVYLYPKFIWNDLQLRDKTNRIQTLMQLNDKGLVSAQTLLEELDLDYDSEVEKLRNESVMASPTGEIGGMGNLGTMGMGGAPGGMPGEMGLGDMAGEMGGMVPGGGMGAPPAGGMGGAPAGGMAPAPAGGMGAAASTNLPIIGKRGSKSMQEKEQEQAPQAQPIKLTSLEHKLYKMLLSMKIKHPLFGQYSVNVPGEQRPFSLDFAYPDIGVATEADGNIWHEREDFKQRDLNRDQKLANVGWRILRFREDAIEEQPDAVRDIIYKNIVEAEKAHKKASQDNQIIKYSSVNDNNKNPVYDFITNNRDNKIGCYTKIISDKIQILYIGTVDNGD